MRKEEFKKSYNKNPVADICNEDFRAPQRV